MINTRAENKDEKHSSQAGQIVKLNQVTQIAPPQSNTSSRKNSFDRYLANIDR